MKWFFFVKRCVAKWDINDIDKHFISYFYVNKVTLCNFKEIVGILRTGNFWDVWYQLVQLLRKFWNIF